MGKLRPSEIEGIKALWHLSLWILNIVVIGGWFNNINYILDSDFKEVSGREILSIIGVPIAPIGMGNGFIYYFEDAKNKDTLEALLNDVPDSKPGELGLIPSQSTK